ncbi:MAG: Gmad2 immunoglobulin-like domain-containing protein [Roseiflexaceae bacterium]
MRKGQHSLARACYRLAGVTLIALAAAACGSRAAAPLNGSAAIQAAAQEHAATSVPPTSAPTPPPSPTPPAPQSIAIETPPRLTLVGSPVVITGRTARLPKDGQLNYRLVDRAGQELGAGTFPVSGAAGQPGSFNASLIFNLPQDGGIIRAELFERGAVAGAVAAVSAIDLAVDAQYQTITIETPARGTQVGSPMVLTGRAAREPHDSRLNYRVVNSSGQQLGAGTFPVSGAPGGPRGFNAELFFTLPINGDTIRTELFDWNAAINQSDAVTAIELYVAPLPQQIIIETPPPLTLVGSPVVINGRTTRFPFGGDLSYRITNANQQIGAGSFQVVGQIDQPTAFDAQLTFQVPRDGGIIRVEIYDQSPDGAVVAGSTIDLDVLAQYQAIQIDTPARGMQVGSPVVLTGRTNLYPNGGQLRYRVLDAGGKEIGTGSFLVDGAPGQRGSYVASLTFAEPANGGNIRVELSDQAISAAIDLYVAPPPPPQIIFETPAPGTQVGSPVVISGRTTRIPASGKLSYRVRNASGGIIGAGQFDVTRGAGQATSFNASLTFAEPAGGGNISVEISDLAPSNGSAVAVATIGLYVAPRP